MAIIRIIAGDPVQQKIDSSSAGDTILFSGIHQLANINLRAQRVYTGDNATIFSSNAYAFKLAGDDITIKGMTFDGSSIACFDNVNGQNHVKRLKVNGNRFKGRRWTVSGDGGMQWACIAWNKGFRDSTIENNVFDPIESWTALYGYGWIGLSIVQNTFLNRRSSNNTKTDQGRFIKLHGVGAEPPAPSPFPEGKPNSNLFGVCERLTIARNYFGSFYGMAIEYQDGSANDVIEDNTCEMPIFISGNVDDHLDCFGFSIVAARSANLICRRNKFVLTCPNPSNRERLAIELGGFNVVCEDNYIRGPLGASIDMNGSSGSGNIRNNRLDDAPQPKAANGAHPTISNNNTTVQLTWDINRKIAGSTWGWGQPPTTTPPVTQPPPVDETAALKAENAKLKADNIAKGTEIANLNGKISDAIKVLTK